MVFLLQAVKKFESVNEDKDWKTVYKYVVSKKIMRII